MAKLNKAMQKQTENASSGFDPIPDGVYHFKLRDVDATRTGAKGPYWSWEFECVEEPYVGRRVWNNTSLSENAAFMMKQTFDAFGVPLDTDTDEMIGNVVRLVVSVRSYTANAGKPNEELRRTNQVDRLQPKDPDFTYEDETPAAVGAAPDEVVF